MALKLAVLASGGGTNFQAILDAVEAGTLDAEIRLIASNREDAGALDRGRKAGVRAEWVPPGDDFDDRLHRLLEEVDPDLIVLAGYLKLITARTVRHWGGRIVNVHPALLPAFGGKGMYGHNVHAAALERGVTISGCTVHFVDNQYDHGPIILQRACEVLPDDTKRPRLADGRKLRKQKRFP